jgi:NitT/TauT family transport system substrate-binding protein
MMAAHVGLDPPKDIEWITTPTNDFLEVFVEGQVDAFLAFPPEPQELRARKIGRAILNTTTDKPGAQYFCCMALGNRAFVRAHPVATKRYLRAILKTADFWIAEPASAAQQLVDGGFTERYDYVLQMLTEIHTPAGAKSTRKTRCGSSLSGSTSGEVDPIVRTTNGPG